MLLRCSLALAALLALAGCSGPCDRLEESARRCGQSFNRANCDKGIGQCTNDDVKTIDNVAACTENEAVCKDGDIKDTGKWFACEIPIASLSDDCQRGLSGK